MRNINAYQSFSVLGLGIVLGVGVFIIVVSLLVEGCGGWFQKRRCRDRFKQLSWNLESILHQQRMAFEGQGLGWVKRDKCDGSVPITEKGEDLF